jgi:hypothetical protein
VFNIRRELCAPCGRTNRTDYIAALRTLAYFGVHAYWFWCSLSVTPITESPKKERYGRRCNGGMALLDIPCNILIALKIPDWG